MTAANFDAFWMFVQEADNDGQGFHVTKGDPGGATNHGMTYGTWIAWQDSQGIPRDTLEQFAVRGMQDFRTPTRRLFWDGVRGDDLPTGLDVITADFAFGSNAKVAVKTLQHVLKVKEDAVIGPETLAAARAADPNDVVLRLMDAREKFYVSLPTARLFARGWIRRAEQCARLAVALIQPSTGVA